MQYQVLLDPAKLYAYHLTVPTVIQQLSVNNSNAGGGFYSQGDQFYYVRGLGLVQRHRGHWQHRCGLAEWRPVRIEDIGEVAIGNAPRLGEFGFNKTDDAVEGVIMMRRGEQTQNVLKGVEAKTRELNEHVLPPDIKVLPYYDRSDLVQLTIDTVEHNLLLGMALVLLVLMAFLVSIRAAVIVALTIPLSLLFSFIFLHAEGIPANLLSIGAIDFGILIDGTLVMAENIFRELGEREGQQYDLHEVIRSAAKDVDRPIYLLRRGHYCGLSSHLRAQRALWETIQADGRHRGDRPGRRADLYSHTWFRCMCSYWFKKGVHERVNKPFEWVRKKYAVQLEWCLDHPKSTMFWAAVIFAATLLLVPFIGGEFMPHLDEGALWVRATMPYTVSFDTASKFSPQVRDILDEVSDGYRCWLRAWPSG